MKVKKTWKIWVHSDLQLATPELAKKILSGAVDDLLDLDLGLDAAWCLGDALCGSALEELEAVACINVEELRRLGVPLTYLLGNHEMDLKRFCDLDRYPLFERVQREASWISGTCDAFYFTRTMGKTLAVFMGDHFAKDGGWWTTHGTVKGNDYPHSSKRYEELRDLMKLHNGPVIIASHYAFPGGQRPSEMMRALLPLPENVQLHLHGHAHIGDLVYNHERPWQRANPIEGDIRQQFNISALENARSSGSHSALLEFDDDGPIALSIRCHLVREWVEKFDLRASQLSIAALHA